MSKNDEIVVGVPVTNQKPRYSKKVIVVLSIVIASLVIAVIILSIFTSKFKSDYDREALISYSCQKDYKEASQSAKTCADDLFKCKTGYYTAVPV